jgi:hypothetical protein
MVQGAFLCIRDRIPYITRIRQSVTKLYALNENCAATHIGDTLCAVIPPDANNQATALVMYRPDDSAEPSTSDEVNKAVQDALNHTPGRRSCIGVDLRSDFLRVARISERSRMTNYKWQMTKGAPARSHLLFVFVIPNIRVWDIQARAFEQNGSWRKI